MQAFSCRLVSREPRPTTARSGVQPPRVRTAFDGQPDDGGVVWLCPRAKSRLRPATKIRPFALPVPTPAVFVRLSNRSTQQHHGKGCVDPTRYVDLCRPSVPWLILHFYPHLMCPTPDGLCCLTRTRYTIAFSIGHSIRVKSRFVLRMNRIQRKNYCF